MVLPEYLFWHFAIAPKKLLGILVNYLVFFYHYFSVKLILKTLFAPWKRQTVSKTRLGFDVTELLNILSFNLISRTLGAIIRVFFLFVFAIFEILTLVFGAIFTIVWVFLPGITFPLYFFLREKDDPIKEILKKTNESHIILKNLAGTPMGRFLFSRLGISQDEVTSLMGQKTAGLSTISTPFVSSSEALVSLAKDYLPFKQFLFDKELDEKDVVAVCDWYNRTERERRLTRCFWSQENLLSQRGIGKDWAYGYTPTLDEHTDELTQTFPFTHHLVGRKRETDQIQQILSRAAENNVLIVGEPGVGRKTIALGFARNINEGKTTSALSRKRVLLLNLTTLLGSSSSAMVAQEKVAQIFKEAASAGNIILVIENFDKYLVTAKDKVDLTTLFKQYAATSSLQIIGITTPADYQRTILPNPEISKIFEKIEINPPTNEEAIVILEDTTPFYEKRNGVFVLYQALVETVAKADQYITDIPFPEKAIDLLDETCVYVAGLGNKLVTAEEVNLVLSQKTNIPLGQIKTEEKEKLVNLEGFLHQRIVDQEEAVIQIAKAMRRSRLGISQKNKPIGSFLFLGPTGVGKTETAKALAACYFGNESCMQRFDMGEFQAEGSEKVLGSNLTREPGLIASSIRQNPFSLLLLDEIEKANSQVLNLFLTVIDEGYFTDAFGRKVDCRNLIIIGTSNAGSEFIRQALAKNTAYEDLKTGVLDFVQKEGLFSPEFLNRFDAVVVYKPLTQEQLRAVATLQLKRLNERLKEKEISIKITDSLVEKIVQLGYDPTFGARPMQRVIQDKIEDQIAQKILKGEAKRGEEIELQI